jgi:soluble lytic murein transglycosylase-like protein
MSILSAIKQQNSSIDDLAALPQAMIMQMAQKKQISEEMLAPILSRKAELAEAFARQNALRNSGQTPPTVMEQLMAQNAQAEQPQMPQQIPAMAPQMVPQMPQQMAPMQQEMPQDMGVAQLPIPERQYAGGGIIAFADGGLSDEDDDYEDSLEEADYNAMIERAMNAGEDDGIPVFQTRQAKGSPQSFPNTARDVGIASGRDDMDARLRSVIMQKESGGRRYDKNGNLLTSSKGALGEMQVMPATARDPGFGIKPAQSDDPNELKRVGDEYASVLLRRYKDPMLAMIAYNMGPGATDKWLAAGADPRRLPKETQGYIRNVNLAHGGEVKHFQYGGLSGEFGGTDSDDELIEYDPYYAEGTSSGYRKSIRASEAGNIPAGAIIRKPTKASAANKPTTQNVSANNKYPSEQEFKDFDQATALFQAENMGKQIPTQAPTQPEEVKKTPFEIYMAKMLAREEGMDKQRAEDRNMALLTAGLGMIGGSSQYASENIGKGALAGVQNLSESKKLRAAEQGALDKSMLLATRYQGAEDVARQNAAFNQANRTQALRETSRANTNKEMEQAQSNLNNYIKIAQANLKDRFPAGEMDDRYQAEMAKIYKSPQYIALSKRAGLDIAPQDNSFAGFSAKMR